LIIIKKKNNFTTFKNLKKIFSIFFLYLGIFTFSSILIISVYFFSSGMGSPKNVFLKVNDKVLNRYLGFDIRKSKNYLDILIINFLSNFQTSKLEKVYLNISQKSIIGLEMQRKLRSENGGELPKEYFNTYPAKLVQNKESFKVKIRTKGVRPIHWKNKDETSYKIDLIGSNRIWGLEEFALQKPITRNYIYEYLFHELLGHVDLLRIKYFFVNLFLNDKDLGVYAVEESFSKELIERQKKRNGPIFGLSEELGEYFPNVKFDLYSDNYWINEYPELSKNLFSVLNNLKNNSELINDYFDLDKWARYFAVIDLTGSYHGLLAKSVKFYYNPTTGLFEPIGYDLHKGAGIFDNFIILDFLQESKPNCSYLCLHKEWFYRFLKRNDNQLNSKFLDLYIMYLKEYSEKNFVENFLKLSEKKVKLYNNEFYKEKSKVDKIKYTGLGYFVYDKNYLLKRSELIRSRINSIKLNNISISKSYNNFYFEDYQGSMFPIKGQLINCENKKDSKHLYFAGKMKFKSVNSCKNITFFDNKDNKIKLPLKKNIALNEELNFDLNDKVALLKFDKKINQLGENKLSLENDLKINQNTILKDYESLIINNNASIDIANDSTLFIDGKFIIQDGKNDLIKIYSSDGSGSIIFRNNEFKLNNIHFDNLSKPNISNYILYGGVNFIDSRITLKNIVVTNSNEEDAMNIINSNSKIYNIKFENIFADALDLDFGKSYFENISCYKINNDCLDLSGVNLDGNNIEVQYANDKALSIGENSIANISNLKLFQNNIGVAVKDGSISNLNNLVSNSNNYDVLLFNKKKEFKKPSLSINNYLKLDEIKILQSEGTFLKVNKKVFQGKFEDDYINSLVY
jgi:hypothetical protein